jgi:hypothetical protein
MSEPRRVLVVGYAAERTVAYTVRRLRDKAVPVDVLDLAAYLHRGQVQHRSGDPGGYRLEIEGRVFALENFSGAYVRSINLRAHRLMAAAPRRRLLLKVAVLEHILASLPFVVINRPGRGRSNGSKPVQLLRLRQCGFLVPDSWSTNMADAPGLSQRLAHGDLVYKSNSAMRSIVARGGPRDSQRLGELANCPVLFQQYIAGPDVRVHLIGDRVFGQEIRATTVDYRYPELFDEVRYSPIDVPDEVRQRCCAFGEQEGLTFVGFDFKIDRRGCWYCLEANPMPGYDGFDERLGGQVSSALIDRLCAS